MKYIIGLDLSLTNAGIVLLPVSGGADSRHIESSVGYSLKEDASPDEQQKRLLDICHAVELAALGHEIVAIGFEQTPFNRFLVGRVITLAQLGGVVYGWMLRYREQNGLNHIKIMPVNIKSARKHLFAGQLPVGWHEKALARKEKKEKKDASGKVKGRRVAPYHYPKEDVVKFFEEIGMKFESEDTMDAYVIASYIRGAILGLPTLTKMNLPTKNKLGGRHGKE